VVLSPTGVTDEDFSVRYRACSFRKAGSEVAQ
jgi:hypothetical protein